MAIPANTPRPKGPVLKPRFVINLDDATHDRLRDLAHRERRTKNGIVRDAITAYLEHRESAA